MSSLVVLLTTVPPLVTSYVMCHVCGCPGPGDKDGIFQTNISYDQCSGDCKDKSDYGRTLPCPTGTCHSLSLESELENNNVTFRRNCFSKNPDRYLQSKKRKMNQCDTLEMLGVKTTECLCDSSFCNLSPKFLPKKNLILPQLVQFILLPKLSKIIF